MRTADEHFYKFNAENFHGDTVILGDNTLRLSQIRLYVEGLCVKIEKDMDVILDHGFHIPSDAVIHDDPRSLKGGWGFLDHPENPWAGKPTLLDHILRTPALTSKYTYRNQQGGVVFNPAVCAQLSKAIHDNLFDICVAFILTFGGLPRGTELLSHLIRNLSGGTIRNVFALFNELILRGSYNKTAAATSSDKTMARIPYPPVGRLMMRHLAFVRPMFCELQQLFRPSMYDNATHLLFAGLSRPMETRDLSTRLSRAFKSFGHAPGTSYGEVRQMVAFIMQCNHIIFQDEDHSSAAAQMGHSQVMHRQHYGGDERFPLDMNDQLFQSTALISAKYQLLLGFPPTLLQSILGGRERQWEILRTVEAIRKGSYVFPGQEVIQGQTGIVAGPEIVDGLPLTVPGISRAVTDDLMPAISRQVNLAVSQAVAAFANIAFPHHPNPQTNQAPRIIQPPPVYLLQKLRNVLRLMGDTRSNMGFSDIAQGEVTTLMWQGGVNIAYITRTSE